MSLRSPQRLARDMLKNPTRHFPEGAKTEA
jgi:hypothetical protein